MRKFTEVLEEYLVERDRQNSDYYDNRFIGDRRDGRWRMDDLANELNELVHGVEDSACPLCGEDSGTTCGMPGCQY